MNTTIKNIAAYCVHIQTNCV